MNRELDFGAGIHQLQTDAGTSAQELEEISQKILLLGAIPPQRLMYSEWLADICCNCQTLENVHPYRDFSMRIRQIVYLCDECALNAPPEMFRREWEPGDE